jgi:hypothetical protein
MKNVSIFLIIMSCFYKSTSKHGSTMYVTQPFTKLNKKSGSSSPWISYMASKRPRRQDIDEAKVLPVNSFINFVLSILPDVNRAKAVLGCVEAEGHMPTLQASDDDKDDPTVGADTGSRWHGQDRKGRRHGEDVG